MEMVVSLDYLIYIFYNSNPVENHRNVRISDGEFNKIRLKLANQFCWLGQWG